MKKNLIIIILFILSSLIVLLFLNNDNTYIKTSNLYISEVLPSNKNILKDNYSLYSDYIELYNGYKKDINLEGYCLSDEEYNTNKWCFSNTVIKSKEYLIIYASGKDICNDNICHTNFKLSSKSETITLSDKSGNIINKFTYPELESNISYGYYKNKYTYLTPTPSKSNKEYINTQTNTKYNIRINEYMTNNNGIVYTETGYSTDFIELYNYSDEDILLDNLYLSDNLSNITKYKLPEVIISKEDYLVIYLNGNDEVINNEIYANFKLSNKDEYLIISNGKKMIDKVKIVDLLDNVSYGYTESGWKYFPTPTIGSENNTASFERIGDVK